MRFRATEARVPRARRAEYMAQLLGDIVERLETLERARDAEHLREELAKVWEQGWNAGCRDTRCISRRPNPWRRKV